MRVLNRLLRPWLALALVCALFSLKTPFRHTFWTSAYLPSILQQSARNIVLAVGMSFVIFTGGIDLSVGSVLALSGVGLALSLTGDLPLWLVYALVLPFAVAGAWIAFRRIGTRSRAVIAAAVFLLIECPGGWIAHRMLSGGLHVEGAICIGLMVGMACGMINGLGVSLGRVPPFVMTLGMYSAARGLTLYATDGSSVRAAAPRFMALGEGLPLIVITFAVVIAGSILLNRARSGRYLLAIGGNEQAAVLSGVPVAVQKTVAYMLAGLAAGVAAVLVTAKFGLADTSAGSGAELDAIAAVVIGGTSLSGGTGSIIGALVGALTITVVDAGLVLVGIRDTLQPVVLGAVIVLTVFIDQIRRPAGKGAVGT